MLGLTIIEKGALPRGYTRYYGRMARWAWAEVAAAWHRDIRPYKFMTTGHYRYPGVIGFRSRRWNESKQRKHGRAWPNVATGESKRRTETMFRITSTRSGASVKLNAPALNFKRSNGLTGFQEVKAMSAADGKLLSPVFWESMRESFSQVRDVVEMRG